ncbi:hypothetical protein O7A70_12590 [Mesorhizobium sp. Cs1299R1N1]|uniref:hypothetical protein n=1 Tax=Mesorhizobium sp. Cs1299R1N1 TaxID=3015172 RepID=UPI00301E0015
MAGILGRFPQEAMKKFFRNSEHKSWKREKSIKSVDSRRFFEMKKYSGKIEKSPAR